MPLDADKLDAAIAATNALSESLNGVKNANTADITADAALKSATDAKAQTATNLTAAITDAEAKEAAQVAALKDVTIDVPTPPAP